MDTEEYLEHLDKVEVYLDKLEPEDDEVYNEDLKIIPSGWVDKETWEKFLAASKWPYWLDWERVVNESSTDDNTIRMKDSIENNINVEEYLEKIEEVLDDYGILYGDLVDEDDGSIHIIGVDESEWEEARDALEIELGLDVLIPDEDHEEFDDELIVTFENHINDAEQKGVYIYLKQDDIDDLREEGILDTLIKDNVFEVHNDAGDFDKDIIEIIYQNFPEGWYKCDKFNELRTKAANALYNKGNEIYDKGGQKEEYVKYYDAGDGVALWDFEMCLTEDTGDTPELPNYPGYRRISKFDWNKYVVDFNNAKHEVKTQPAKDFPYTVTFIDNKQSEVKDSVEINDVPESYGEYDVAYEFETSYPTVSKRTGEIKGNLTYGKVESAYKEGGRDVLAAQMKDIIASIRKDIQNAAQLKSSEPREIRMGLIEEYVKFEKLCERAKLNEVLKQFSPLIDELSDKLGIDKWKPAQFERQSQANNFRKIYSDSIVKKEFKPVLLVTEKELTNSYDTVKNGSEYPEKFISKLNKVMRDMRADYNRIMNGQDEYLEDPRMVKILPEISSLYDKALVYAKDLNLKEQVSQIELMLNTIKEHWRLLDLEN